MKAVVDCECLGLCRSTSWSLSYSSSSGGCCFHAGVFLLLPNAVVKFSGDAEHVVSKIGHLPLQLTAKRF